MSTPNTHTLETTNVPQHIGIILDGNRRWAVKEGLQTLEGHKKGAEVFRQISLGLFDKGVKYVSGFIFSTENWQRKAEEVDYLMRLVIKAVEMHLDEYHQNNIRIKIVGARNLLKPSVLKAIKKTEEKTAKNDGGTLALCFNYGGHQEIVDACKEIINKGIASDTITEKTIADHLYAPDIPDVDLLVRTSSEKRTSGFMLWRAWYAELAFIDTYWPDVTIEDFDHVLEDYSQRKRRFGC